MSPGPVRPKGYPYAWDRARAAGYCWAASACWQSQPRLAARLQSLHGQAAASGGRNGTATLESGRESCLLMPAPPAPVAAPPAPQLPEDDDEETPKRRSGGRQAVVVSSDESDNASASGDDPIEPASAPKKATGMKGLMALAAPRLLGTKAARLLGAGVSKGKSKGAKSIRKPKGGKSTKGEREEDQGRVVTRQYRPGLQPRRPFCASLNRT
eukprot:tig00000615_g2542.t1